MMVHYHLDYMDIEADADSITVSGSLRYDCW